MWGQSSVVPVGMGVPGELMGGDVDEGGNLPVSWCHRAGHFPPLTLSVGIWEWQPACWCVRLSLSMKAFPL